MKTLQNNFTTPEQSKRLLELGVHADSADCYLTRFGMDEDWEIKVLNNVKYSEISISNQKYCLPCWSVGQLIKISELCYFSLSGHDYFIRQKDCNTDFLVQMFELGADRMDFSKLED